MAELTDYAEPLIAIIILTSIGAFFMQAYEGWSLLDAYYWSTVTLATVGYGDLLPTKPETKIFTIFYIILGVSAMLYFLTKLSKKVTVELKKHSYKVTSRFKRR